MDPIHQFQINPIVPFSLGGLDVSFTNSSLAMAVVFVLAWYIMVVGTRRAAIVPNRMQSLAEMLYEFVSSLVQENAGRKARPYFPLVFSIFIFVLFGNLVGLVPGMFTYTSHIIVTFALGMMVIIFVTVLGITLHGVHFFSLFMPPGAPIWLAPVVVPIEIISYFIRPISLGVRLFANMMAGHTMLKVFAGFVILMASGMGKIGYLAGIAPIVINIALTGFEIMVAILQAYVFSILTCLYIHDAVELH
ncbi:ATP synthase subunit a [uncultured Gammaproteobacteria bacterium]